MKKTIKIISLIHYRIGDNTFLLLAKNEDDVSKPEITVTWSLE